MTMTSESALLKEILVKLTEAEGSFAHSLTLTDIHSGWTECAALVVREQTLVVEGISLIRRQLPFALRGLDTDNDSVFMNETLQSYCREHQLEWTRSRAYRKNDQAWVEPKNGAVVRRLAGYGRLRGQRHRDPGSPLPERPVVCELLSALIQTGQQTAP